MRLLCRFFLFHDLLICCIHPQLTHRPTHAPSTYPPTHTCTLNLPTDPHMHPQLTHRPTHAPSTCPPTHTCTLNLPTDPHMHPQLTHRPTHAPILPPPLMSYHTLNCLYDKFSVSNPYLPFSCSLDNLGQCTYNRKDSLFIVSTPIKEQLNSKII